MNNCRKHNECSLRRFARNGEAGLTLIEILVALGILAAVAVIFLMGMSTSSKAVITTQNRVTVESLAKSEMEYIKSLPYNESDPLVYGVDPDLTIPADYNVSYTAVRLDPQDLHTGVDEGLQKITVTVTHTGGSSITIEGYKLR